MGRVYLGRSPGGDTVAVKVVHPTYAGDRWLRQRFVREVDAARRVESRYTVTLLDADTSADQPWLVTPYVRAYSLAETVAQHGPLPEPMVRSLGAGLAMALQSVHAVGVIHRDLKPSNVLMAVDGPRLVDFGISQAADALTDGGTAQVMGSAGYMSPEQIEGGPLGPAADVFALGAVLNFALTGVGPYGEGSAASLLYRVVHGSPDVPVTADPVIGRTIKACLARHPAARPTPAQLVVTFGPAPYTGFVPLDWLPDLVPVSPAGPTAPPIDTTGMPLQEAPQPERMEFAAAYRREIQWNTTYPLLFFVLWRADHERVQKIISRRAALLGSAPTVSHRVAAREVLDGATLTVVPTVLGVTFSPARIDVVVGDDLRELTFNMNVPRSTVATALDGYIDVFVGPLIIGQVPVTFEIRNAVAPSIPRQAAEVLQVANASIFDTVFVSYSHKDSEVVDLCVATYEALGVDVLMDKLELRAGEEWRVALREMIETADVFQLYWSASAAASREVEGEWRHALTLSINRDRFIRPVYWEQPRPDAPPELNDLHFAKLDLRALRRTANAAAETHIPAKSGLLKRTFWALRRQR
jgi:hypothetical protein